jgi:hypothetical protein
MFNVYDARHTGREYCCDTEGEDHYKGGIEPMDLILAKGFDEGFCIGSVIKYVTRFAVTRNLKDLKKASDYVHIICGATILRSNEKKLAAMKTCAIGGTSYATASNLRSGESSCTGSDPSN